MKKVVLVVLAVAALTARIDGAAAQFGTNQGNSRPNPAAQQKAAADRQRADELAREFAKQRETVLQQFVVERQGKGRQRTDIRGFYLGMTRPEFFRQVDRLNLRSCGVPDLATGKSEQQSSYIKFNCRTFSALEASKGGDPSEIYSAYFSEELPQNVLLRFSLEFLTGLEADALVEEVTKQYAAKYKPPKPYNSNQPLGAQLFDLLLADSPGWELPDGSFLTVSGLGPSQMLLLTSETLNRQVESAKKQKLESMAPRPRF